MLVIKVKSICQNYIFYFHQSHHVLFIFLGNPFLSLLKLVSFVNLTFFYYFYFNTVCVDFIEFLLIDILLYENDRFFNILFTLFYVLWLPLKLLSSYEKQSLNIFSNASNYYFFFYNIDFYVPILALLLANSSLDYIIFFNALFLIISDLGDKSFTGHVGVLDI